MGRKKAGAIAEAILGSENKDPIIRPKDAPANDYNIKIKANYKLIINQKY
jgi:hypothetical protein